MPLKNAKMPLKKCKNALRILQNGTTKMHLKKNKKDKNAYINYENAL